jgi:hypothetical protein
MDSFLDKRSKTYLLIHYTDFLTLLAVCLSFYVFEITLYYSREYFNSFLVRILHSLLVFLWLIKMSPRPGSLKNYLLGISMVLANIVPYYPTDMRDSEGIIIPILLLSASYILMSYVFMHEKSNITLLKKQDYILNVIIFIIVPSLFFYFIVFQGAFHSPYFNLMTFYMVVIVVMLFYGTHLRFSRFSRLLVTLGLVMITVANEINTYDLLVEHIQWVFPVSRLLSHLSRILIIGGFVNEELYRRRDTLIPPYTY